MREDTIYLLDVACSFIVTCILLLANDVWGFGGGLDRYVLGGALAQWFHHWFAIFLVPILVIAWWFLRRNRVAKHVIFTLMLVCIMLFFSEWILVSPIKGSLYWAWIQAEAGGLI